ncbi:hypothetical protein D7V88_09955 [Corallococcus terminator]|uniref:Uncharacterized protein n=1 Tax=Corallococcus terminator TaxID=2316733 RepID=A0A3A8JNL1_9BACT|nr:hypothetical protein D7V88_09955 [Corallococcus terminator]
MFFRDMGQSRVGARVFLAQTRTPQGLGACVVLKRSRGDSFPDTGGASLFPTRTSRSCASTNAWPVRAAPSDPRRRVC